MSSLPICQYILECWHGCHFAYHTPKETWDRDDTLMTSYDLLISQQGLSRLPFGWTRKLLGRAKCRCIYVNTADVRRIKIFSYFWNMFPKYQLGSILYYSVQQIPISGKLLMSTAENILLPTEGYVLYDAHGLQQRVCARKCRLFAPHKGRSVFWSYETWSAVMKSSVLLVTYYYKLSTTNEKSFLNLQSSLNCV